MKLNLDFYQGQGKEISEQEKNIIQKYIEKYKETDYENKFSNKVSEYEIYYLSTTSQNILNWYPFDSKETVLEIGGDLGQLTGVFTNKCANVITIEPNLEKAKAIAKRYEDKDNLDIIVGNIKNIKIDKEFDYIILIGIINRIEEIFGENIKLVEVIKKLEKYLDDNGKFIIAVDNKFGLRYLSGNPENILNKKFKSMVGYSNEPKKVETFTKKMLENIVNELGYNANFYYPLPDYKMPNVIFSDKQLPKYNSIDKYNPYFTENSTIIMNEIDVFREILKSNEEMFTFFANSFLIEISRKENPTEYKYISFNNMRKEDYRLITKIAEKYVEKQPVDNKAKQHYETIKENIKYMKENNIKTVDYEREGKVQSKYIKQELLLNNIITQMLENGENELLDKIINKYIEVLNYNIYNEEDYENTVFAKYNIEIDNKEIIKDLHFQKRGLWDMTFKNCFYIDNEFYFFDQEWAEENLPTEYILYRSIIYTISLRRFINIEDWLKKYNLKKYEELFKKLDDKLQEKIRDNFIWGFYSKNKDFDIDGTKQELINMEIRSDAQKAAIENLQKEKESIQKEKEKIQKEYEAYRTIQEKKFTNRVKRKVKGIIRRK